MFKEKQSLKSVVLPSNTSVKVDVGGDSLFKTRAQEAKSLVDYLSSINIDSKVPKVRNTLIICSIGSASSDVTVLKELIKAGMNIACLNFSRGSHAYHLKTIENIRVAVEEYSRENGMQYPLAIAMNLKGPQILTGFLLDTPEVELKKGNIIKLTTDQAFEEKGSADYLFVDYPSIAKVVKIGGKIFLDYGLIGLTIKDLSLSFVTCCIDSGGMLGSRKHVQLVDTELDLPSITTKDREDLPFALANGIDIIFAPFVRNAATINELRYILGEKGKKISIFSKIENRQGVSKIKEIVKVSSGVIVCRADLGTDMSAEKVFTAQTAVIARCNKGGVPVVCSTQVLDSMIKRPLPMIAEVNDIGNAIVNGTDCIMLTGETEWGEYPVESVKKLVTICKEVEEAQWLKQRYNELSTLADASVTALEILAMATVRASIMCRAAAIIVITKSGGSAQSISRYRPRCPIIAVTRYLEIARKNHVFRGVLPVYYSEESHPDWSTEIDARVLFGMKYGLNNGFIKIGDHVVIVSGWKKGSLFTNTMRVKHISYNRAMDELVGK